MQTDNHNKVMLSREKERGPAKHTIKNLVNV